MKKLLLFFSLLTIINNDVKGYCDIKGSVNNPGVYEIRNNETINDIIKKAGGLKKNSYTDNINLSKLVNDEMVIYIHSEYEINKLKNLNKCKCEPIIKYKQCETLEEQPTIKITNPITTQEISTTSKIIESTTNIKTETTTTTKKLNNKININTATIEELIKLNGLGESKAKKIIEYRNNIGVFQSIEDLLKVDGIGVKTFENIKEFIEI